MSPEQSQLDTMQDMAMGSFKILIASIFIALFSFVNSAFAVTLGNTPNLIYEEDVTYNFVCGQDEYVVYLYEITSQTTIASYQCYDSFILYSAGLQPNGLYKLIAYDQEVLYEMSYSDTFTIDWNYIPQVATAIFAFVDRNVSEGSSANLQTSLVGSVSNLWPILILIVGLVLVFYTLDQITKIFSKNLKEKRKRDNLIEKNNKYYYKQK